MRDAWIALVSERWRVTRRLSSVATLVLVGVSAFSAAQMLSYAQRQYERGIPLGLPGAERISLPPHMVLTLRTLAENARVHAGVLFSGPGMYSFNLWSERPAPTMANATIWPAILEPEAEREIIARLDADSRAVVIERSNFRAYGALYQYLEQAFQPAFELNGYRFLVHRGRRITRVSSGRIRQEDEGTVVLELILARSPQPITSLEIRDLDAPGAPALFRLQQDTATLEATALSDDGEPSGPTRAQNWPVQLGDPITLLRIRFAGQAPAAGTWVANVLSREGRIAMAAIEQ
jgi:hypothetical protein